MVKGYPILLVVRPPAAGSVFFSDERREEMLAGLRRALAAGGMEAGDSSAELLLFNFDTPFNAISALYEHLALISKRYELNDGTTPRLQFILHLESKNEPPPAFRHPTASIWEELAADILYISRALKLQWENLLGQQQPAPLHKLEDGPGEMTIVRFAKPSTLRRQRLFPHRAVLAGSGSARTCFYCGLRTHVPAKCPAKQLSMDNFSLPDAGYQPLAAYVRNFQAAFANHKQMQELLGPGVELGQVRKNPPLQAFVSYFDLGVIYQPRYLAQVVFAVHSVWPGLSTKVRIKMENRNMQMGLDCLRVGQLDQARELFMNENQAMGGKQYAATVGLAFVALERGRFAEVGTHLQLAASLAAVEKEKIHIALLLARYHDLAGNLWKAEQSLQSMANLYVDCHEIVYRRVLTMVRKGEGTGGLKLLAGLVEANRLYFMNVLQDPALLPIEGLLEDLLKSHLLVLTDRAEEAMAAALKEYERLGKWIDGEDEEYRHNLEALNKLQQQLERRSYNDLCDVAEKARALRQAGPRLQEKILDALNEGIDKASLEWENYHSYWQEYPYQKFWRRFDDKLRETRRMLVDARGLAAESLSRGRQRLETASKEIQFFAVMTKRMGRLRLLLDSLRIFIGKLVVAELAISALLLVAYPVVTIGFAQQVGPEVVGMIKDPAIQKKILFVTNLALAPIIAFAQTIRRVAP